MKICMIGNSHLAMLVNAQRQDPIQGLEITPVSWPRGLVDELSLQGTTLRATGRKLKSVWKGFGLPDAIELGAFDLVVFVSHTVSMHGAFAILRDHAVLGWNDTRETVRQLSAAAGTPDERSLISPDVFAQCLTGLLKQNLSYKFVEEIRGQSGLPIAVIPEPYLAEETLTHQPRRFALRRVLRCDDGRVLTDALHKAHEDAFGAFEGVTVFRQPAETVVRDCLTKEAYRKGATRFGTEKLQAVDDTIHAGPALGRRYLQMIRSLGHGA